MFLQTVFLLPYMYLAYCDDKKYSFGKILTVIPGQYTIKSYIAKFNRNMVEGAKTDPANT